MTKVTICRKWNHPMISISVSNDSISLEMTLEDFLIALSDEVAEPLAASIAEGAGNPAFWFTKKALTDNLVKALESKLALEHFIEATNKIIGVVKSETNKVV